MNSAATTQTSAQAYARMSQRLQNIILDRVEAGTLSLPALPKAAAEVQPFLEDNNIDLNKVSSILDRDPLFAAQVIRLANSALHRRSTEIQSISQAVTHVGARAIKQVLLTCVARQAFVSHNERINHALTGLWEHSVAVAFLARNVAGIANIPNPEHAYLTGLLHDIGKAVCAMYLLEFERSLSSREATDWIHEAYWLKAVEDFHRPIGAAVAKAWNLSKAVERAINTCGDYDPEDRLSAANAVMFANALAKREGIYVGDVAQDAVGSLLMIGKSLLNIDDNLVEGLTRELGEQNLKPI